MGRNSIGFRNYGLGQNVIFGWKFILLLFPPLCMLNFKVTLNRFITLILFSYLTCVFSRPFLRDIFLVFSEISILKLDIRRYTKFRKCMPLWQGTRELFPVAISVLLFVQLHSNTSNECVVIEITPQDATEGQCKIS